MCYWADMGVMLSWKEYFKNQIVTFICPIEIHELKQMSPRVFADRLMCTSPADQTFEIALCHLDPAVS